MDRSASLPTLRRNTSTGAALRGSIKLVTKPTRRRPKRTGSTAQGTVELPTPVPTRAPRLPKLKVRKKETRNVELRGQARLLQELTDGISKVFPNILPLRTFVEETNRILNSLGFTRENTLAVVGLSRDEQTRPLLNALSASWGEPYVTHSLGSQCNVGPTGLKQILDHAPQRTSREKPRVVIFSCPNIACNQDGDTGWMYRPNKPEPCATNAELMEYIRNIKSGAFNLHTSPQHTFNPSGINPEMLNPEDLEMSIMCSKMNNQLVRDGGFNDTSLASVSRLAGRAAKHDFEVLLSRHVDLSKCDVALISAVQVHGQYQDFGRATELKFDTDFVAIQEAYGLVGGERREFKKDERQLALEFVDR